MPDALSILRENVATLCGNVRSKRAPGKLEKAKAIDAIADNIAARATIAALSENSTLEMCVGPPSEEMHNAGFLSWSGLAVEVILSMAGMCEDALTARTKKTTIRPEYMTCIRILFKNALSYGPPGALRSIVPAFLSYSYQWLSEPALRDALADDIWQCVRDILQVGDNRAMLSAGYLKRWTDVCFQQITGRGPVYHNSRISLNFAHEAFVLLAKPVATFDVLTQSQKGVHGSEMEGTDFGYALLLERCCFILVLAKAMKERQGRQLQTTALKCIGTVLERHSLDLVGSTAAKTVIELAIPAVLSCWTERGYHDCAVEAAKGLVRLAHTNHPAAVFPIRERIERDFGREDGASSVVRAYEDVKENEVEVAGSIFSVEDIIAKIKTRGMLAVHVSAWLRVLSYVLAFRRMSNSNLTSGSFETDSCSKAVQTVSDLFSKNGDNAQRKLPIELLRYICAVIQSAVKTLMVISSRTGPTNLQTHVMSTESRKVWSTAYLCLLRQLMLVKHASSYRASRSLSGVSSAIEQPIMHCIVTLLNARLVDKSALYASSASGDSFSMLQIVTWQTLFSDGSCVLTEEAARFAHAHIAQAGVRDHESRNYRINLANMLATFCDPNGPDVPTFGALKSCISGVLGLSRGVCRPSREENTILWNACKEEAHAMNAMDSFIANFSSSAIRAEASAKVLVERARMISVSSRVDIMKNLFHITEKYWSLNERRNAASSLSDILRFNVERAYRDIIERDFVAQMLSFLDEVLADKRKESEPEASWAVADSDSSKSFSFQDHVKARFICFSDAELQKPLGRGHAGTVHVAFLIAEYLEQGCHVGSISWQELGGANGSSVAQLQCTLFLLLTKLAATPDLNISGKSSMLSSLVASCSNLYLLSRDNRGKLSSNLGSSGGPSEDCDAHENSISMFGNLLSRLVGNLCQSLCAVLEDKTFSVVEKVKFALLPDASKRGTKRSMRDKQRSSKSQRRSPRNRKKRRPNSRASSKRNDAAWSDDSDQDAFGDEMRSSDSEAQDIELRGVSTTLRAKDTIKLCDTSEKSNTSIQELARVVILATRILPQFSEIVLEQCKSCLQNLLKAESRLSPDGPSRALIASAFIDCNYFAMRTHLWEILLELESGSFDVGKDIVHFGKKWEILEELSYSVVSCYANELSSGIRKHYPPLEGQENLRIAFMDFASRLLLKVSPLVPFSNSMNPKDRQSSIFPQILSGIIDIGEVFRIRDAFRMPRYTRIAYLHFAIILLNCVYCNPLNVTNSSQETASVDPVIFKSCQFIRKALNRLLSDCDATVRMAAAGAFHIFMEISKQADRSNTESVLQDALPNAEKCQERDLSSSVRADMEIDTEDYDDNDDGLGDIVKIWKLSRHEAGRLKTIKKTFRFAGASAKSVTALVALGEIASEQSDFLPLCLFELIRRVANDASSEDIAFNVIIRICMRLSIAGPEELFAIVKRLVFPKWFAVFKGPRELMKFPAHLFFDADRCRHGGVFDWMRNYNAEILPFILLSDSDSLELSNSKEYSNILGEPLDRILSSNVGAFSRIFPMICTGGSDHRGHKLWLAIDSALKNQSQALQADNRDDVHISLLMSISAGNSRVPSDSHSVSSKPLIHFWRDCREIQPPYYDSLIVATSLETLHRGGDNSSVVWRRSDLHGSLLHTNSSSENGGVAVDFSAASTGFLKKPGTLIRMLHATWKLFSGPPGPVHPQNRVDAFFVVATLWKIAGVKLLLESNRRRLLLNLVLRGFRYAETAHDALWLLHSIAQCSIEIDETKQVTLNEVFMNEDLIADMDMLISSCERRMFELLSVTLPVLVEVALGGRSKSSDTICQKVAADGLLCLVQLANAKEMWAPIAAVDMVPDAKVLKEVRKIQEYALTKSFSKKIEHHKTSVSKALSRFIIAERRCSRGRRQLFLTLTRLKHLRNALSEANRARIASLIHEEAWLRSEGRPEVTLGLLNELLGFLIDINHDVTSFSRMLPHDLRSTNELIMTSSCAVGGVLSISTRELVLQECAWLIGVLGSIYPTSVIFESGRRRKQQRLNSLQQAGVYETAEDGVVKALPLLRECIFGECPVISKAAYTSLVAVLGTRKGKNIFTANKKVLEPLTEFRAIARKICISEAQQPESFVDSDTGAVVEPVFRSVTDSNLWAVPKVQENASKGVSRWLMRLAATLAWNSANDALHMLSTICFASADFSRSMFPYLLMDIVSNVSDADRSMISKHVSTHVLNDAAVSFEAVRVMVHGLDFLCQLRLDELLQKGVGNVFEPGVVDVDVPFLYYLDIPYLVVAEAAVRVGMYFSAVRYASLHVDHACVVDESQKVRAAGRSGGRGGTRRLSSRAPSIDPTTGARDSARKAAEPVLLLAAENINEPDMIRGLGQQGDLLETASNMAVLDSDWGRSAGTLDALCHRRSDYDSVPFSSTPQNSASQLTSQGILSSNSEATVPSRELMLLNSLRGLGCTNLVTHYWDILKRKMGHRRMETKDSKRGDFLLHHGYIEKLNEQRFAAAWKLGDWESPELILPAMDQRHSEPIVGLHQTIHKALSAFSSADAKSVFNIVQAGREAQASWLGQMDASESAQRVYQVADRVCVLNEMESVANIATYFGLKNKKSLREHARSSSFEASERSAGQSNPSSQEIPLDNQNDAFLTLLKLGSKSGTTIGTLASDDFKLDLHISIARCLGMRNIISRISADVAATLFARGGSGAWARAAAALGNMGSVALDEAPAIDVAAWHLQEAKLRWAASEDGRLKQFALAKIKALIEKDLGGAFRERPSKSTKATENYQIEWAIFPGDQERIATVRAEACQLVASWSAAIRAEEPMILFRSYLEMGLLAFKDAENNGQRGLTHYFMAEFAAAQLSSIDNYRKTKKYDQMVVAIQETEKKVAKLESLNVAELQGAGPSTGRKRRSSRAQGTNPSNNLASDLKKHIYDQKRRMKEDRSRLESLNTKYKEWQRLSCHHYASSIRDGSQNDLRGSFRLVALWLDSGTMREQITADLVKGNPRDNQCINVPLAKLLPLAPQLCSRLGSSTDVLFQNTLAATLERMAILFPSHCLWQLLALSNSTKVAANDERCASFYRGDKDKKEAADRILERVHASGSSMIAQMKILADAYIKLSEVKIERNDTRKTLDISRASLFKTESFSDVPVPTTGLPMYGTEDSSFSPPLIEKFEAKATICNGLSKPLKVVCVGSDGHRYPQMVKGKDDLRGDAVMEQMFTILNELLRRDPAAARRSLLVRTYRVVPLSPFSGIMQFVDNTAQFKELLVDEAPVGPGERKALHERYRPHDMKQWEIRAGAFQHVKQISKKIQYLSLHWHRFQPVFRYFFLERWPDPADWYTHQLAYTRSVAVMSIVGFILGIGDRHLSNILVDTVSGEAVHIDFGIAFEQGKLLPTPELMPFRLSRDIVDGFGVSGVDGTFRHCSEVTLEVMRKNKDVLLTVIEVLLHDPMYNWALTPEEVLNEQLYGTQNKFENSDKFGVESIEGSHPGDVALSEGQDGQGSKEAQRALRRIAEKLDGLEDTERLSVQAHVARLIDEARAFQVLASVYPGWAPWL